MTTEEKAKAYDKALTLMKDCIPDKDGYVCVRPCDIFSELKESQDEKIRKALIRFHKSTIDIDGIQGKKIIAWLEKQGEPKWSDEDEELLQHCCGAVAAADYYTLEDKEEMEKWLKSLRPRKQWKPSEEQIKWLKWAINRLPDTEKANEAEAVLEELLEQLNEL